MVGVNALPLQSQSLQGELFLADFIFTLSLIKHVCPIFWRLERAYYYKKRDAARDDKSKCMSIIFDGMDQGECN